MCLKLTPTQAYILCFNSGEEVASGGFCFCFVVDMFSPQFLSPLLSHTPEYENLRAGSAPVPVTLRSAV